jgi:hypothetical protein
MDLGEGVVVAGAEAATRSSSERLGRGAAIM